MPMVIRRLVEKHGVSLQTGLSNLASFLFVTYILCQMPFELLV